MELKSPTHKLIENNILCFNKEISNSLNLWETIYKGFYVALKICPDYAQQYLGDSLSSRLLSDTFSDLEIPRKFSMLSDIDKMLSKKERLYKNVYWHPNFYYQKKLANICGEKFIDVAEEIEKYGIVSLPNYFNGDVLKAMQNEFNQLMSLKQLNHHRHIQFGAFCDEEYLYNNLALSSAMCDPLLWALGAYLWGQDPALSLSVAYRIEPIKSTNYKAYQPHNDGAGKEYKVMILLTDLAENGQRMIYWPGTHKVDWPVFEMKDTVFSLEETEKLGKPINCSGEAGTVYIFNSNGIHSGMRNFTTRRDVLLFSISAGDRLYRIPRLPQQLTEKMNSYQKHILRVGREKSQKPMTFGFNDEALRWKYWQENANIIKNSLEHTPSITHLFPSLLSNNKKFPITISPIPENPRTEKQDHRIPLIDQDSLIESDFLSNLTDEINRDIAGSCNLPIRLYSGTIDPARNTAISNIRDKHLEKISSRQVLANDIIATIKQHRIYDQDKMKKYIDYPRKTLCLIDFASQSISNDSDLLTRYQVLMEDLISTIQTTKTLDDLRHCMILILGTIDYLKKYCPNITETRDYKELYSSACYFYIACIHCSVKNTEHMMSENS